MNLCLTLLNWDIRTDTGRHSDVGVWSDVCQCSLCRGYRLGLCQLHKLVGHLSIPTIRQILRLMKVRNVNVRKKGTNLKKNHYFYIAVTTFDAFVIDG